MTGLYQPSLEKWQFGIKMSSFGHIQSMGLRQKTEKSVLMPTQRTMFLVVEWESTTMRALKSPAHIESILAMVSRVKIKTSL